ncbi:peptidase U32 family protein [Bariatricus sp. SGI.154]|uniref:peptidase U32 family protein n=1 Tax=Bariatricus sp. SGI.154 TaxID=3420549 RepID=UPI003CFE4D3B
MGREVEILAPAGSYESLRAAVSAGADAVYIGGARFGARAYAKNLSEEELLDAIDYVHIHGRKIYLTVNTLLKEQEIGQLYDYLLPYYQRGLDGVIVQDMGVVSYLKEYFPELAIHASTQMTITNAKGASFLKEQGIVRVVPARELSLDEIRKMKEETGLEIECFVHGALCYCYSGQCLLSSMIGGRSGNRGQCAQPCRLPYSVEGGRPADLMSLKDLCTIDLLPELIEAGIDSFKIEGRMKQPDYVYTVVSIYRKYADLYLQEGKSKYKVDGKDRARLLSAYQRRGYTDGYYKQHNGKNMISFQRPDGMEEEIVCSDFKLQEKINGNLILSLGERAKLILEYGDCRVEYEGAMPEQAMRQPLDAARVEKQMRKTGNTEFVFDRLEVTVRGELFLPMQALNELRREGIERLSECILKRYHRKSVDAIVAVSHEAKRSPEEMDERMELSVSVQALEQLRTAIASESIGVIYVDSIVGLQAEILDLVRRSGEKHRYFLALPYISREDTIKKIVKSYAQWESVYDGVLIRNWESYRLLRELGFAKEVRSDYNLYVYNSYSKAFVLERGIRKYTSPVELNDRELKALGIRGQVMIGYGYQPVMITANCVQKTSDRCTKDEGYLYIHDRYQKKFAVKKCCRYCYNIIYNSAPLFLADKAEEIRKLAPGELRLDFTMETAGEMMGIMKLYIDAFLHHKEVAVPEMEFTRGHFKRGVK